MEKEIPHKWNILGEEMEKEIPHKWIYSFLPATFHEMGYEYDVLYLLAFCGKCYTALTTRLHSDSGFKTIESHPDIPQYGCIE
jgi:hypothetical protein